MLTALAFFAGGIAAIISGIAQWERLAAARRWASVDGEVHTARVIEQEDPNPDHRGMVYKPDIRYSYVVGGVEHAGSRRQLIVVAPLSRAYAQGVVQRYPPGHRVTVYYDPDNPRDAVLEIPDSSIVPALYIVVGVAISIIGIHKWWHLG